MGSRTFWCKLNVLAVNQLPAVVMWWRCEGENSHRCEEGGSEPPQGSTGFGGLHHGLHDGMESGMKHFGKIVDDFKVEINETQGKSLNSELQKALDS